MRFMLLQHNGREVTFSNPSICLCKQTIFFVVFSLFFPIVVGQLSSMAPMNGPLSGGTIFTVTGTFNSFCSTRSIQFNTVAATGVVFTASSITGTVPAYVSGATSPATILYSGSGSGGCTSTQSFSASSLFSYDSFLFSDILYGSKDTAGGGSITISGKNFLASSLKIGSTSSSCVVVTNFVSFKCALPAFSLGARNGLDLVITMNSVQTTLVKFAYDAPVLSKILPQVPKQDGSTLITIFGSSLEAFAPTMIRIGALSCDNIQMITPHQEFSCLPSASNELVRTNQHVRVSLNSGATTEISWNFEPMNTFLHSVSQGTQPVLRLRVFLFAEAIFADSRRSHSFAIIGTGLSLATVGQLSSFSILLIDSFAAEHPQRSGCDQFIAVSSDFGNGETVFANSSAGSCQNGTYSVLYNVTKAGKFALLLLILKG